MIRSLILSAGTGIPYVLLSIGGLAFAPATHAAIIVPGGVPLFNAVFSRWFERNRPSLLYRCGLYLILAGILMIGWDLWSIHAQSYLKGDLLFLCASECYTWYTIAARSWNIAPLDAAVVVNVISFIFYLPVYIFIIGSHFENAPIGDIALQAVYQGIITSIIVVMALTYTVKILGSTVAAAFIALVPVLAALLAMSLLGEIPSILQWIGIIATSTGMLGIVFGTIPAISLRRRESTVEKSISHTFGESGSLE
jgi:drug/metabolite transporter (DMT)-like permease